MSKSYDEFELRLQLNIGPLVISASRSRKDDIEIKLIIQYKLIYN